MRKSRFLVSMPMVTMTLPRMSPTQHYRTILLSPVQNPKPHNGTQALAGDNMPKLWLMQGQALVSDTVSMPSSHLFLSLPQL
uniref:Uncharacterized protein n=1 Tax=Rhizophora mucronata TaxID=61149 RepID=A0A2P2JQ63_RHIMU